MASSNRRPLGNIFLNAVILYVLVFTEPTVMWLEMNGWDVQTQTHAFGLTLTLVALSCLTGQRIIPVYLNRGS